MIARERLPLEPDLPAWSRAWDRCGKPASGLAGLAVRSLLGRRAGNSLGILMYHRIVPRVAGVAEPTWNVTPRQFRRQLEGLLTHGYRPLSLREALQHNQSGGAFPSRRFIVTFDDGYQCLYHDAFPILTELRIPATIFVPTAYLDSEAPLPFETWSAAGSAAVPCESWRSLTTSQCQAMMNDGLVEIGTHTHTHDDFRGRPQALADDLSASLEVLRDRLGVLQPTFAFPFGRKKLGFSSAELAEAARRAGAVCALTTESDLVVHGSDPFDWGRFTVTQADTPLTLQMKLDGWYSVARQAWRRWRALNPLR
jgi:peptidoglycan/xylan/chitin deacetylase (PgdA/CDA1 family)